MRVVKLFVPLTRFGLGIFNIDLQGFIQISDVSSSQIFISALGLLVAL